jgi:sterol desaturase/sphingolipid hydroxylase (fatty acid hydroxylase superfamily)
MSIDNIIPSIQALPIYSAGLWLIICLGVFSILQEIFPFDKSQPRIRKDSWVDVTYWIASPLLYSGVTAGLIFLGFYLIFSGNMDAIEAYAKNGASWARNIPIWLQAVLILVVQDISLYWTHRLFHQGKLWNYHAIHHGAQNLDWLHSVRFHPLNVVFHSVFANALVLWMGFSPLAVVALLPFNTLYSAMVHANLNWTFGPYFRYVFASPVFHRWHHTSPDEGGNMNFAATFPILDVIFGTYYMPEGKLPGPTGLYEDYVPKGIFGQLLFPFMPKKAN